MSLGPIGPIGLKSKTKKKTMKTVMTTKTITTMTAMKSGNISLIGTIYRAPSMSSIALPVGAKISPILDSRAHQKTAVVRVKTRLIIEAEMAVKLRLSLGGNLEAKRFEAEALLVAAKLEGRTLHSRAQQSLPLKVMAVGVMAALLPQKSANARRQQQLHSKMGGRTHCFLRASVA